MEELYLGEIRLVAFGYAPDGYLPCDGRLLQIGRYSGLYSLLGVRYGGDGNSTFGLPDLRGRVPVHQGNGPGLRPREMGETAGTETVTLTAQQIGPHSHALAVSTSTATATGPAGNVLAVPAGTDGDTFYATNPGGLTARLFAFVDATGGGQPHDNTAPTLPLNYVIATEVGTYPTRS